MNVTFNKKTASLDGLQPWCRECDHANKPRAENAWPNFLRALKNREPPEDKLWTKASYVALMEKHNWSCKWCGGDVSAWSSGYWIDKIDPNRGYKPDNCLPCCWPCNSEKSNRNSEVFAGYVDSLLKKYGRGKVPWQVISPKFKRADESIPDLTPYVRASEQLLLFGAPR